MAKIPPESVMFPGRGVSLKGAFYTRTTRKGFTVVRWPRKQPTPANAKQADRQKLIAVAARVTAYMTPQEQDFSRKVADVTKLQSRDFLMLALFARIGHFVRRDGTKVYSMASMQDISDLLDALGQVKGMVLYRDETWWTALPIGDTDEVLTVGDDGLPFWKTGGGGGGAGDWFMGSNLLRPMDPGNTYNPDTVVGVPIFPRADFNVAGLKVVVTAPGTGKQLTAGIYGGNGGTFNGSTLMATSAIIPAVAGLNTLPFTAPLALTKDTFYWMAINVTGGSGNLQMMRGDPEKNNYAYFAEATGIMPGTAPAVSTGTNGLQFNWYLYQ